MRSTPVLARVLSFAAALSLSACASQSLPNSDAAGSGTADASRTSGGVQPVATTRLDISSGSLTLPPGPGIGVTLDDAKLEKYRLH